MARMWSPQNPGHHWGVCGTVWLPGSQSGCSSKPGSLPVIPASPSKRTANTSPCTQHCSHCGSMRRSWTRTQPRPTSGPRVHTPHRCVLLAHPEKQGLSHTNRPTQEPDTRAAHVCGLSPEQTAAQTRDSGTGLQGQEERRQRGTALGERLLSGVMKKHCGMRAT